MSLNFRIATYTQFAIKQTFICFFFVLQLTKFVIPIELFKHFLAHVCPAVLEELMEKRVYSTVFINKIKSIFHKFENLVFLWPSFY